MRPRPTALLVVIVTLSSLEAGAVWGQSVCTTLKFKAAGQAALAKAKCESSAAKNGTAVDPTCIAKAEARLAKKFSKAEKKGDCVNVGDLASAQSEVDDFVTGLRAALISPPPTPTPGPICCDTGTSCWHGFDGTGCVDFGGTVAAPGTACDGATGTCRTPPVGTGNCCYLPSLVICEGGPDLDLAGCVAGGGLDFPFGATCQANGACSFAGP